MVSELLCMQPTNQPMVNEQPPNVNELLCMQPMVNELRSHTLQSELLSFGLQGCYVGLGIQPEKGLVPASRQSMDKFMLMSDDSAGLLRRPRDSAGEGAHTCQQTEHGQVPTHE